MAGASTSNEQYVELVRSIKSINDMDLWMKSAAKYDIISFIKRINVAIQGKKLSTKLIPSRVADNLLHIFDTLNKMINETPPIHDKESYCNWFEKMRSTSTELPKEALPLIFHPELIEVSAYFTESFGN